MGEHRFILLTGPPGVGKTTLITKVCQQLEAAHIRCQGFYTKEVRVEPEPGWQATKRIGFDVITLQGQQCMLARLLGSKDGLPPRIRFGKYAVFRNEFETLVLPQLDLAGAPLLVIDEIGNMELTSKKFKTAIAAAIHAEAPMLATIPQTRAPSSRLVADLRNSPKSKVFEITRQNRDGIQNEIVKCVEGLVKI